LTTCRKWSTELRRIHCNTRSFIGTFAKQSCQDSHFPSIIASRPIALSSWPYSIVRVSHRVGSPET